MTKERLAQLLDGREYRKEMTKEEEKAAKDNNLLVLFGASDDLLKIRGALHGEEDALWDYAMLFRGDSYAYTDADTSPHTAECNMLLPLSDDYDNDDNPRLIRVEWVPADRPGLSWRITSNLPFAPFTIREDGEPYCEGIVIDFDDVPVCFIDKCDDRIPKA